MTGSKYLLEAGAARVLIDCGAFQGLKSLRLKNWEPPPFAPGGIQAVVLTHAHIDHTGLLPRLVRQGFRGPIYGTAATTDLAELLLYDAAKIHEEDAEYANRRGFSKHKPALPLFDSDDVQRTIRRFQARDRQRWFNPAGEIWMRYHEAGHLLGSSFIEVEIRDRPQPLRLLFSGDVGRYNAPLYHDPRPPATCDYLVCESTYGDRDHPEADLSAELEQVVLAAMRRGGVLLVAAFAVGRAQQLIYLLRLLMHAGKLPKLPVFLDSPMAVQANQIFATHAAEHDLAEGQLQGARSVLVDHNIHLARTPAESKAINAVRGPAIIISSSGMMTGGRILHHLRQRLPGESNTILLAGYQAAGTRGRSLQDGQPMLRIHGQDVPVRCAIERISGLSGHAGRSELARWLAPLPPPRRTYVTHGEKESAEALAAYLRDQRQWAAEVPRLDQAVELE